MGGETEIRLLAALAYPAFVVDAGDALLAANEPAIALSGRDGGELVGLPLREVIDLSSGDERLLRADGERVAVSVHFGDLGDGMRLLTARDVGPDRRIASQLADAERIAGVAIWEWHVPTGEVVWSDEAYRLFGVDPETTTPTYELWLEAIHPDDRDWVDAFVKDAVSSRDAYDFEHRVLRPRGEIGHLHCRGRIERADDGTLLRVVGVSQDITERVRKDDEIARAAARHHAVLDAAGEGICELDGDGAITFANPAAATLLGTAAEDLLGLTLADRMISGAEPLAAAISAGLALHDERATLRTEGTEEIEVAYHCAPFVTDTGPAGAVVSFADASERSRYERQLRYLAEHDALTGLLNRRRFEEEIARAGAGGLAVLLLDLDHFKDVNDTRGHGSGDQLIRSIARSLEAELGRDGVLSRLGGDEFAVLLPAVGEAEAMSVAERLRRCVADHLILTGGARLQVTASIGVAILCPGNDPLEVLADADVAMYDAKAAGRNKVTVYRHEHGARKRMEARLAWTTRLRRALDIDGFELHAQPIVSLEGSDEHRRFELLLRLPHPDGDAALARPADFLPVAERHGLIREIDRWVAARAVEIAAACRRAGEDVRLEVNLSGQSMVDPGLPAHIAELITASGAGPEQLIFEVTETAAIDSLHEARTLATNLVELGCEFAIDDFGVGFGSFAYLKHLPIQYVKIDGDFIRRLPSSPNDQLVVRAVATIAKGMGKRTIAEFVETQETMAMLRDYGIDFAQGYVIARPMPVAEAIGIATRGRRSG